ncbi:MAG: OsmC family protein [bacterium]|nr:OsmC family protein [bacterium]
MSDGIPTISCTWTGGRQFVHRSATGHALVTDTPAEHGGGGTAPSPMELVVMGLAGCTGVDVASILEGMRQPLRGLTVTARFERAADHPRVFTRIDLHYRLEGDLDPARVERAVALSQDKYCSVSAMLAAGGVALAHTVEILP